MVLADDNFATIVAAVEGGRRIYDNLLKFVRLQIANLFSFILAFLGSAVFSVAGTALFEPLQVLWIHFAVVGVAGITLGTDVAMPGIMNRAPRPRSEPIISTPVMILLWLAGVFMAAAALVAYQVGNRVFGSAAIGQTMALATLSLINIPLAMTVRFPRDTVFRRETVSNPRVLWALLWILVGTGLITSIGLAQQIFHVTALTLPQWGLTLVPAVVLIILVETGKAITRMRSTGSRAFSRPAGGSSEDPGEGDTKR